MAIRELIPYNRWMADEIEVETKDLQEEIEEIHKDREERAKEELASRWTRYIALTTAILAAFAAVAALQSGALANEGMLNQLQASDKWTEYQSSRQKSHLYSFAAATLLDSNVKPNPITGKPPTETGLVAEVPGDRLSEYLAQIKKEDDKAKGIGKEASGKEKEAEHQIHEHHRFAYSVALLQVAIALGAVSALTKIKPVWYISGALGVVGIVLFFWGFTP